MSPDLHILVADNDPDHLNWAEAFIRKETGAKIHRAENGLRALDLIEEKPIDVIVADLDFSLIDGLEILRSASAQNPPIPIILVADTKEMVDSAIASLKTGTVDIVSKPAAPQDLRIALQRALHQRKLLVGSSEAVPNEEFTGLGGLIGTSQAMQDIYDDIRRCAPFKTTVLICGESGTGKELVARALHAQSPYGQGPFIALNCSAMPHELVESQLFGHEKGAFTGASTPRKGVFEAAESGTLFLDEIGDLPLEAQAKLLRAAEDHQITRLGSNKPIDVNVRLLAATNVDLEQAVLDRRFREDLYYRLNVLNITLPPLKEREEDIPMLIRMFLDRFARENDIQAKIISPEALTVLTQYNWPGNVRELKNMAERMAVMSRTNTIDILDLPPNLHPEHPSDVIVQDEVVAFTGLPLAKVEHILIERSLKNNGDNRRLTAKVLGISLRTLQRKLKEYGQEA
ncbi:MAG: DNA-binding NtrC family response regulator [Candidatus Latescibacterota bacterium]|jgi:DNA-binding NtrC family response regulator